MSGSSTKTRLAMYGVAGLGIVGIGAYTFRGLLKPAHPVNVTAIEGESAVLPLETHGSTNESSSAESKRSFSGQRSNILTIDVAGRTRRYVLIEPSARAADKRYPLVLVFHGDGGDAPGFHAGFPFERASGDDAYVVFPEGLSATWDLETKEGNRDLAYVDALVGELARAHPIDREHVFATGYSSGGFFANLIACRKPGLLRAFTSSAGGAPYNQAESWPNGFPKCPGQKPTPMMALHGTNDFAVTLDSGRFSAEYWAYVNGCDMGEMETTGYPECRAYRHCGEKNDAVFCTVSGLGHWVWDRAAEASWTFFLHH